MTGGLRTSDTRLRLPPNVTKKNKKNTKKAQKPLTISIHGNGIDIDAKFADSELGDVIAKVIKQTTTPPVVMPPTEAPKPAASNYYGQLAEFTKSLTADQISEIVRILTAEQKMLFMEIMETSKNGSPHDFDIIECVIKYADTAVLQSILTLVNSALEQRAEAS